MNKKSSAHIVISSFLNRMAYDYSCVVAPLPDDVSEEIRSWGVKCIPEFDLGDDGREDNIHVTVKYGLHTVDPFAVRDYLMQQKPIKAILGKTSIFESDSHDVVKLDVHSPQLHALNKTIADNFAVTDTYPEYIPHVTIAYVKPGLGIKYDGRDYFDGREVILNSVVFSGKDNRETLLNFPRG